MHPKTILEFKKDYAEKFSKATGKEIHIQPWGGNRQLSMEGIAVEYFPTSIDNVNNKEKSEFHSYISDNHEQDACNSHAHMVHLLKNIFRIRKISAWYVNSVEVEEG